MGRAISAILGVLCILLAIEAEGQGPTVQRSTTEVLVDMVARDKHSKIVRDLKPEEIQILEDGVPQTIRHFELFESHESGTAGASLATPSGATAAAAAAVAPSTVRTLREATVVSIVVGSLNPEGRKSAQSAVREFIKNELRPNTFVGIFVADYNGVRMVQPYTNDGELISAAMERVVKWTGLRPIEDPDISADTLEAADYASPGGVPPPPGSGQPTSPGPAGGPTTRPGPATGPAADIAMLMSTHWINESLDAYDASMRELLGIQHFVQAQARIPGRKLLFLFAGGLIVHPDTIQVLDSAISVANRSNVTIYSVDTIRANGQDLAAGRHLLAAAAASSRSMQTNGGIGPVTPDQVVVFENSERSIRADERGNMRVLAESTGGAMLPIQDLREPFHRAMEDARTHYELTYSPARSDNDGRFRKIEVRVSRPGVKVFARSGYYALPLLRGEEIYPFELATLQAMNATPLPQQLEFQSDVLRFRPGSQRNLFSFACEVPVRSLSIAEDKESAKVHVSITALVKDAQGQVVDKFSKDIPYSVPEAKVAELRRGVVSFTTPFRLPPGHYSLEIAAVDGDSGHAGVRRSNLVVPPVPDGLAVSDLVVARRVDPDQEPQDKVDPLLVRGGKVTPELSEIVDRDAPGDVFFYAAAYPPAPAKEPVRVTLEISRDEQPFVQTRESNVPVEANSASFVASFPRAKLQPGQYKAVVTFRYQHLSAQTEATFRVEAGEALAKPPH